MGLAEKHCVPCEGGITPMSEQEEDQYIKEVSDWQLARDGEHKIRKDFKLEDFEKAIKFVDEVAEIAEEEGHHPDICIHYNKVDLELNTHAIGGLHENDFIMASKIDRLFEDAR
ncbi:4a-hydroxytetrahydrobiopterin dehydratase [candidate division KSB1 bacterium]|nr:4a-hydroxytetrahydrobiopterin dehydratase [candidate division KSB1 bacterium]